MEDTNIKEAGALSTLFFDPKAVRRMLLNPIKKEGLGKGLWDYVKKQMIPKSYSESLLDKSKALRGSSILGRQTGKISPEEALKLRSKSKGLAARATEYEDIGKGLKSKLYQTIRPSYVGEGFNLKDRASALKALLSDTARIGGHYGMGYLNPALIAGIPAYGTYQAIQAPSHERGKMLGGSLGEALGFLALGPMGVIPAIAGSSLGATLGEKAGKGIQNVVSPPSLYRKMVDALTPEQKDMLKGIVPTMIRGAQAGTVGRLGYMPMSQYQYPRNM